jgi:NADPH:quinone reductase-like Zn-dependent oxidoreductase
MAAMLPVSGITALQGLRDAGAVKPGDRVLVHGASGGVGHLAVQIAKILGAQVTAVCRGAKADAARACGADEVIDYAAEDFVARGPCWDVIFDLVGNFGVSACLGALRPGGRYVSSAGKNGGPVLGALPRMIHVALRSMWDDRLRVLSSHGNRADLDILLGWLAQGRLVPHVGHVLPLERGHEALALLVGGEARGKVALRFDA